ncbi:hypothetical protein JCM8208_004726 [Rhodotorula glutinis]
MPPKRPIEVLTLDSDSDDDPRAAPLPPPRRVGQLGREDEGRPVLVDAGASEEDEEEDAALALAIRLSLEEEEARRTAAAGGGAATSTSTTTGGGGAGGLNDRAELERQRLARQRARGGSDTAAAQTIRVASTAGAGAGAGGRVRTFADLRAPDDDDDDKPGRFPRASTSSARPPSSTSSAPTSSSEKHSHRFWRGAIKRVPSAFYPSPDSYSFADLVGSSSTLQAAVVSAYVSEPAWVVAHFADEIPLLLVQARLKGDAQPALAVCSLKPNTFRVVPKERSSGPYPGVMHDKFMIYYHDDYMRVVIPTANAISYDWDTIDNALFVVDFPYSPTDDKDPFKNPTHTQFSRSFLQVCFTLDVPKRFVQPASQYDFSASTDVRLVHSTQGKYALSHEEKKGGGLASLACAVSALNLPSSSGGGTWHLEATGSSIGRYTPAWLSQMLGACAGELPSTYFGAGKGRNAPRQYPVPPQGQPVRLPIKIVFPTEGEITGSFNGAPGGGTLFCPVKTWDAKGFPQHLFYRGESKRARVAAHTKILLALQKWPAGQPEPEEHHGWMYLGSHNFTSAAWGRLENGSNGPTLAISNYELGVVLPIRAKSAAELEQKASDLVTYRRPLSRYSPGERPWQQERFL